MVFIRDCEPLPCDLSQSSTSLSRRVVTTVLVGLWNRPRTAVCHCASLSSGISLVSISLSGRAAAWIDWPSAPPSTAVMCLMYNLLLIASSLCWRRLSGGNDPHRPFPSPFILPFCLLLTARNCLER